MLERQATRGAEVLLFARNFFRHPRMLGSLVPELPLPDPRAARSDPLGSGARDRRVRSRRRRHHGGDPAAHAPGRPAHRHRDQRGVREAPAAARCRTIACTSCRAPRRTCAAILESLGIDRASYVISGIPLQHVAAHQREHILKQTRAALEHGGQFLVYQFSVARAAGPAAHLRLRRARFRATERAAGTSVLRHGGRGKRQTLEFRRHARDGARDARHDVVDLVARDDQRRREAEDVSVRHRAHDHAFFEARRGELRAHALRGLEARALRRVPARTRWRRAARRRAPRRHTAGR